jgi:hypothetical protein
VSTAWSEQCWAIAALAIAAVVLNAITTGDNLLETLTAGYWPVAAMDLMLCVSAVAAAIAAAKIQRRTQETAATALDSGEPVDA